jgi:hypothetical protein
VSTDAKVSVDTMIQLMSLPARGVIEARFNANRFNALQEHANERPIPARGDVVHGQFAHHRSTGFVVILESFAAFSCVRIHAGGTSGEAGHDFL